MQRTIYNSKPGMTTKFSYSEEKADRDIIGQIGRVFTIEQGKNRIVLTRQMIDKLPQFAERWKVK